MNVKEVIGHRIKYTLNARGMEDKELAKILEVTDETAFDYLHGWRDITAEQIITRINQRDIFQHVPITSRKPVKPDSKGVPGFFAFWGSSRILANPGAS